MLFNSRIPLERSKNYFNNLVFKLSCKTHLVPLRDSNVMRHSKLWNEQMKMEKYLLYFLLLGFQSILFFLFIIFFLFKFNSSQHKATKRTNKK